MEVIELRCERNPSRLFAKLLASDETPLISENLFEFKCRDCQKQTGQVTFHRFDILGELVETESGGTVEAL